MCIAIIYFPRCYDKKFEINHNQAVFLATCPKNKKTEVSISWEWKGKIKSIFHHF